MKIVSINLEGTDKLVSANFKHPDKETHGVAFNLDRPLSPDAKEKLMSLKISNFISATVEDSCLIVTTKGESIDSNTVKRINEKLDAIEKAIEKEKQDFLQKRKDVLEAIAENTKLDFDQPLESVEPDEDELYEINVTIGS